MEKKLMVISGPSGAGIGDAVAAVFARRADTGAALPVTASKKKAGETDGVGFRFYDLEGWNALKESGDLLEIETAGETVRMIELSSRSFYEQLEKLV